MKSKIFPLYQKTKSKLIKNQDEKLLIVELQGGLGNQLFQFANGVSLSIKGGCHIVFEMKDQKRKFALQEFGINENTRYGIQINEKRNLHFSKVESRFPLLTRVTQSIVESKFTYQPIPIPINTSKISGYFQSYKYFSEYLVEIKNYLSNFIQETSIKSGSETITKPETTIHVRLGDYFNDFKTRAYHGLLNEQYFLKGIEEFGNSRIVLVTESEQELSEAYPNLAKVSSKVLSGTELVDFTRLARANHLIIANSSFSWWAALLSNARIIAPKQWFSKEVLKSNPTDDLFPKDWKLI